MAADTFSTDGIGVMFMGTGNDNNTWGSNLNSNVFQILADAVTNTLTNTVSGGTLDLSGTPPPAASSQTRYAGMNFTGTLTSNQIVVVPNLNKWWRVKNATAGAFTLTIKTTSGVASTAIPRNSGWQIVQCDGANGIVVWPFNTVQAQMPNGSISAPAYGYVNETNSGWYRAGTQDMRLAINGVDVLQVTGAGASVPSIVTTPNTLTSGGTPSGSVVQLVQGGSPGYRSNTADNNQLASNSTIYVKQAGLPLSNLLSVTITPTAAINKIQVIARGPFGGTFTVGDKHVWATIIRGASTQVGYPADCYSTVVTTVLTDVCISVIDTAGTTSPITYAVAVKSEHASNLAVFNSIGISGNNGCTIVATELKP